MTYKKLRGENLNMLLKGNLISLSLQILLMFKIISNNAFLIFHFLTSSINLIDNSLHPFFMLTNFITFLVILNDFCNINRGASLLTFL